MGVIRQLKNFFTGKIIYPKTLTKAVYDENGERLDKILRDTMLAVDSEEYNGVEPRDADTLGGKYTAKDIGSIEDKLTGLNSSLNIRYNKDTDYIQICLNGEWYDYEYAKLKIKEIINESFIFYKEHNECSYSKSTNLISLYGLNGYTYGRVMCTSENSYDLTNVNKVSVTVLEATGKTRSIAITTERTTSYTGFNNAVKTVSADAGTIEIDVSELTGKHYIALYVEPTAATQNTATLKVSSITLNN